MTSPLVRLALQGGLSAFALGITYDTVLGKYAPTTNEQLAPMLKAIFDAAPADNTIATYLGHWDEILWQIYPDYQISAGDTISGGSMPFDQVFLLQQLIKAFEQSSINYDIAGIANARSVDQGKIITALPATATAVNGTGGTDFFYITPGNHAYSGGAGSDCFVGKNSGDDTILDYGKGEPNELLFTSLNAGDVYAAREGEGLLLTVLSTGNVIRIISIVSVDGGVNGTTSLDSHDNVVLTANSGYIGAAAFQYTISDGNGGSDVSRQAAVSSARLGNHRCPV